MVWRRLATVMVPLGITAAIIMARFDTVQLHQSGAGAFLSIPFYDMIAFCREHCACHLWAHATGTASPPDLHATCGLMDAAFGRFDYLFDHDLFFFPCLDLLLVLGVGHDLLLDRRVHKVYLWALPLLIVGASRYTSGRAILPGSRGSPTRFSDNNCIALGGSNRRDWCVH
jgi:hypothetical protein